MEGSRPHGLWLWVDCCSNGPVWAEVNLSPGSSMFLTQGWKSFACSRGIGLEHLQHFWFDGTAALSVRFFGATGIRLECCVESSSDSDIKTSSDSGDDRSVFGVMLDGDKSEQHGRCHGGIRKTRPYPWGRFRIDRHIVVADLLQDVDGDIRGRCTPT
ncbi:hypothetical protein D1007_55332 [Hordeum vulgare]|nr:hypothetical protein D1007_55332 [Hordeum vulgare]